MSKVKRRFTCSQPDCDKDFASKQAMKRHVNVVHLKLQQFKCGECNKKFGDPGNLKKHVDAVHVQLKFDCHECGGLFSSLGYLRKHVARIHEGKKPFACDLCPSTFAANSELTSHRAAIHEREFACSECTMSFKTDTKLQQHIDKEHLGLHPFKCDRCEYRTKDSGDLLKHVRSVHEHQKPFKCPDCDLHFSLAGNRAKHVRAVHLKERPHSCGQCESKFATAVGLKHHVRAVHDKIRDFACEDCGHRFEQKGHLRTHINDVHLGLKPHSCEHCPYTCSQAGNLRIHLKSHERQNTYKHVCTMIDGGTEVYESGQGHIACDIRCKTAYHLQYHIQRHHTQTGIAQKRQSERKLAEFLDSNDFPYSQDWANRISSDAGCYKFTKGTSARPDFHLFTMSAALRAFVLVGNDEYAHRYKECDFERLFNIVNSLAARKGYAHVPVVYIRFSPHWYLKDGVNHDPPLEEGHNRLLDVLRALEKGELPIQPGCNLIYINYDCFTNEDGGLSVDVLTGVDKESYAAQYVNCVTHIVG